MQESGKTVTKEEFRRRVMDGLRERRETRRQMQDVMLGYLRERRTRAIRYQTLRQKQGRKPW